MVETAKGKLEYEIVQREDGWGANVRYRRQDGGEATVQAWGVSAEAALRMALSIAARSATP